MNKGKIGIIFEKWPKRTPEPAIMDLASLIFKIGVGENGKRNVKSGDGFRIPQTTSWRRCSRAASARVSQSSRPAVNWQYIYSEDSSSESFS